MLRREERRWHELGIGPIVGCLVRFDLGSWRLGNDHRLGDRGFGDLFVRLDRDDGFVLWCGLVHRFILGVNLVDRA